jgi:tetratricopeptide (TPR) repeat protein
MAKDKAKRPPGARSGASSSPPSRPSEPPIEGATSGPRLVAARPSGVRDGRDDPATDRPTPAARIVATSPTRCLERALHAKTPDARARYARAGLNGPCDLETKALLLRQLYLAELERGRLVIARELAEQIVELTALDATMADVAHHDAARACQAVGEIGAAIEHLKRAVQSAPIARRGFHLSTLGGLLYAVGRADEGVAPLERALTMPSSAALVVRGQLALCRHASGLIDPAEDRVALDEAYVALSIDKSGEGYGRFVLGELAFARGDRAASRRWLESFVVRARSARAAARIALGPEIAKADATLARILAN